MLIRIALAALITFGPQSTALANAMFMNHDAVKGLVRLSLWYEGAQSFNKSAFRPGATEELLKSAENEAENAVIITEELAVALEKANF